jgi:hypothetical protein
MPQLDGPFQILKRINNNTYKVNLPCEYGLMLHLIFLISLFDVGDDSWTNSFEREGTKQLMLHQKIYCKFQLGQLQD